MKTFYRRPKYLVYYEGETFILFLILALVARVPICNTYMFNKFFFFEDFIYLFMRDTHRERQRHRQREKQASCREPDVGLDPDPRITT